MDIMEIIKQSFASLKGNKLRSFLTMLGIVMGVFSVIAIVATGNAVKAYINSEFEKLGANIITIQEKSKTVNENDWLTLEDMEIIKKAAPIIKNIDAYMQGVGGTVRVGDKTRDAVVVGIMEQIKSFSPIEIQSGRFINSVDERVRAEICLVDESFAKKYYGSARAAENQKLVLKNAAGGIGRFTIVGILKSEGGMFDNMFGDSMPVMVYMPITTAQAFTGDKKLRSIRVAVKETDKLQETGLQIVKALEFKHGNKDKYMATNTADMQKQFNSILGILQLGLGFIAAITLIVGGIGIVNIMLVSVTERIREIGIRKALGAQKKDIVVQFITEAIFLTGIGGIIGIILGIIAGAVISSLIKIPPVVDLPTILFSFGFSLLLGLLFGVYPAKRAADLDPIESLRYE